jgi:uncharacterized damage-inducible protein DinB
LKALERFYYVNDLSERFYPEYRKLTPEQLSWKLEFYKNNIEFLLRNVAQSEDWFLRSVIIKERMTPKRKTELETVEKIMAYLDTTRDNTLIFLKNNSISILDEVRNMPEGYRGEPIENPSVGWILNRIFDHEIYHYAQVNVLLRLQGIDPPNM